jgi:hypothetical protein
MSKTKLTYKHSIYFLLCISVVVLLLLSALNISEYFLHKQVLGAETKNISNQAELLNEREFWEKFLEKNPTYYEGWIELANIELLLGNTDISSNYILKAKEINPNRE